MQIENLSESSKSKKVSLLDKWYAIPLVVALVFILWGLSWILIYFSPLENWMERGQFGDMFGVVNALFSGLAFAGIIYTIMQQHEELKLSRRELRLTRNEFKKQNSTLSLQKFENTFFNLIQIQNDIVKSTDIRRSGIVICQGKDSFKEILHQLTQKVYPPSYAIGNSFDSHYYKPHEVDLSIETLRSKYMDLYKDFEGDLSHYFRSLYTIVRFVDTSLIENKKDYVRIIRAQLSSQEYVLLFYNCSTAYGAEKFKPLIEKYSLFKNLNKDLLYDPNHANIYDKSAYK